jgi:MFS family permease
MPAASPYRRTLLICLAEILALAAIATFPALLPEFRGLWRLSNTQAGWISAAYFAGYMLFVPVLAGITDRVDARKVMAGGAAGGAVASFLFALFAEGFWSALVLRFAAGICLAGVYMPGLKVVSDHTEGSLQSRFVSFYTASFAIGTSLSYLVAGEIEAAAGWRWAFAFSGATALLSLLLIGTLVPPARIRKDAAPFRIWGDFAVVLRTAEARAYILGYTAHMWELFCMRAWIVAFLAFSLSLKAMEAAVWTPTRVAFFINLVGLPASIGGNELARIFGRRRLVASVMVASAALGCLLGASAALPYALVAVLALAYGVTVVGDSAALTAGAVGAAPEGFRGATLAVHSTLGFAAAFAGPLVVGVVLDAFGGGRLAWAAAFAVSALSGLLGVAVIARTRPRPHRSSAPPSPGTSSRC